MSLADATRSTLQSHLSFFHETFLKVRVRSSDFNFPVPENWNLVLVIKVRSSKLELRTSEIPSSILMIQLRSYMKSAA